MDVRVRPAEGGACWGRYVERQRETGRQRDRETETEAET